MACDGKGVKAKERWISCPSKYVVVEYVDTQMGSRQVDD